MAENKQRWINGIDSIRFFLSLIVLLSHFPNPLVGLLKTSGNQLVYYAGVALNHMFFGVGAVIAFFIISGFVIHYPNRNKKEFNTSNFLIRRWLRIGIPLLVVGLIAGHFNYFGNIPVWSLWCELIYYTIYPILFRIRISWKLKMYISFIISLIVMLLCSRDSLSSLIHQQNLNYNINYWQLGVPLTWLIGLPCWLLGVSLAQNIDNINYQVSTLKIFGYRLLVFVTGVIIFSLAAHKFVSVLFTLNFYALLLCIWIGKEIVYYRTHPPVKLFECFGRFSYSLYLCHQLCLIIISRFLPYNQYTYCVFIILSLGIAYVVYLLVEFPSHWLAQKIGAYSKKN